MKNLTTEQKATFKRLVQLGDSEELALETVLAMRVRTQEELDFYRNGYEN